MSARIIALLKIRPEETRLVAWMAVLFLSAQAGQGIGENAAFTLFLSRLNVEFLPYMYMGLGVAVFIASVMYAASLSRFQNARVITYLFGGIVAMFFIEWIAIVFLNLSIYPILWLTTFGMSVILGTMIWTTASEVCDARQAKRLFPLFASMGILGSVLGNALTGAFANYAGTENLVLLYALLLGVGFITTRIVVRAYFKPKIISQTARFNPLEDVRSGYEFVSRSGLFKIVAITSILYSVLFFAVDFPFSETLSRQFAGNEAGLAGFKGAFTGATTLVTFLVSLFLANRVYTRLGIVNAVLLMPLTYVVGFIVFFLLFNLQGAIIARFSQLVILGGLSGTAWNALFNVIPSERRGQVMAFTNGVPSQIGVIVSGLLIILSKQILDTKVVLLLGVLVALVTFYLTRKMIPAYGEALISALRAGRAEVFTEGGDVFAIYQRDPSAVQVILRALDDPKASTRRLAVEMLAKMGNVLALPDLILRLHDSDASVRAAAIQALAQLGSNSLLDKIVVGLDDVDDSVREQTLTVLPQLAAGPTPELTRRLERLLEDPNVEIRAHAAAVLIFFGDNRRALNLLANLLKSEKVEERRIAIDSYGHILDNRKQAETIRFDPQPVLDSLNDSSPVVRREAIQAAGKLNSDAAIKSIAGRLADEDAGVRKKASESLKQAWVRARSVVIRILESMNGATVDAALDSIPTGDPEIQDALRRYIQKEVSNIQHLRMLLASIPRDHRGPATRLLEQTLRSREAASEERLIKAVGLFGNPQAMNLARKSLHAGDANARAAALEALETLGDKQVTREILPILDRGGVFQAEGGSKMPVSDVMLLLMNDEDYWLRALAVRAVPELNLNGLYAEVRALDKDPVQFVRDAARDALARMDGEVNMKTLNTLSTLERILLLRDVPMFSKLAPEDLEKIAEIAQEQFFASRSLLFREGDPGKTLFIIVSGRVDVSVSAGRTESVIASRGPGEFVGEMAILESAPRSATLRASDDVRALVIDGDSFNSILIDRPEVAVSVLRHMSGRVRQLSERIGVNAGG